MSSVGAFPTAVFGRGFSAYDVPQDYKVLLPPLTSGTASLNSVFLHCDVSERPYRLGNFRNEIARLAVLKDIAAFGAFRMNHVWMLTLHSSAAKQKLVKERQLQIKGKLCLVIDPDTSDVSLKLHWVPFYVPDEFVRRALEPYGKVLEVARDKVRSGFFAGIETKTRLVRMTLKDGVTKESLPHQLKMPGANALVLVPASDCVRTYASVTNAEVPEEVSDHIMEADEAEATYGTDTASTSADPLPLTATDMAEQSPVEAAQGRHDGTNTKGPVSGALTPGTPSSKEQSSGNLVLNVETTAPESTATSVQVDTASAAEPSQAEARDGLPGPELCDWSACSQIPDKTSRCELKWKDTALRKSRFDPKPRNTPDDRTRGHSKAEQRKSRTWRVERCRVLGAGLLGPNHSVIKGKSIGQRRQDFASRVGCDVKTVTRIVRAFREEGRIHNAPHARRPSSATPGEDQSIIAVVVDRPAITIKEIQQELGPRGLGPLVKIDARLTAEKYGEILGHAVLPFLLNGPFQDGPFTLQQDNCPLHHASQQELWEAVREEWDKLRESPDLCSNLYDSLPKRLRDERGNARRAACGIFAAPVGVRLGDLI
ncbi:hypothetical protein HPB47_012840 [Ixodes persulcatus]|uniref:Uncharacterized protein n=1 Tax=Ixodes persulcatus TaxID=34615 RepID=A0AC60NSD9_IXOPE|nr:hypothetical protein HPB47_012840 [Ixodes persulcatus]